MADTPFPLVSRAFAATGLAACAAVLVAALGGGVLLAALTYSLVGSLVMLALALAAARRVVPKRPVPLRRLVPSWGAPHG